MQPQIRITSGNRRPRPQPRGVQVAAAAAVFSLAACAPRSIPPNVGLPPAGATVSEIARNPGGFAGRVVTVSGEVNRVFGPRWFSIGGEGFGGSEELLVVGPSDVPSLVNRLADSLNVGNDLVQVSGVVRVFEEDAIEKEINADLDGDWWRLYDAKPVLIMTDLDITPRADLIPTSTAPVTAGVVTVPITDELIIVGVRDRTPFVGRGASLIGTKVQRVVGSRSFWVGPSSNQRLFVVVDSSTSYRSAAKQFDVEAGQMLAVTGVIKAVPSDLSRLRSAWGITAADEAALRRDHVYLAATDVVILDADGKMTDRCILIRKDMR